jgi:prevent-host-death family protein
MTMDTYTQSTTIGAGEFKAHCLRLIDEVSRTGEPLTITKRGKPLVKMVPMDEKPAEWRSIIGCLAGMGRTNGDIIGPLDVEWEAMKDEWTDP